MVNTVKAQARRMYAILSARRIQEWDDAPRVWINGPSGRQSIWRIDTVADCEKAIRGIRARARKGEHIHAIVRHIAGLELATTTATVTRPTRSFTPGRQWVGFGRVHVGKSWGVARPEHRQGVY